jgi:hypothetical protein
VKLQKKYTCTQAISLKRHAGEPQANPRKGKRQEQTIDTKVFKLLEEGKTPIQVATTLNLPSVEDSIA